MTDTLNMQGFAISNQVIDSIVTDAVVKIEGVAFVMGHSVPSQLFSFFRPKDTEPVESVTSELVDGAIEVTVPVAVFYGYDFPALAEKIREATLAALKTQISVDVARVNVRIDQLIFPKN